MAAEKKQLTPVESFFYYLACICSFGAYWILKIVIQKAIIDAN